MLQRNSNILPQLIDFYSKLLKGRGQDSQDKRNKPTASKPYIVEEYSNISENMDSTEELSANNGNHFQQTEQLSSFNPEDKQNISISNGNALSKSCVVAVLLIIHSKRIILVFDVHKIYFLHSHCIRNS